MPTSTPSTTMRSPWRAAVIGIVALLAAGIGLAVGSFVLENRAAAVGGAAAYVPASAPLYLEIRVDPSASQDAALRELLGRFPPIQGIDLERPLYDQFGELIDSLLEAEDADADVSWADDVAPWFDGRVGFAVTEFPPSLFTEPVDPMQMPDAPPMLVLVGVTDAAEARESVERLITQTGPDAPTFTASEYEGVTIHESDGADGGAYAITADQLILAASGDHIVAAIEAQASGAGTLAELEEMEELIGALPVDWLAFAVYDMTDVMTASLEAAGPESSAIAALIEHQPMRGAMTISARDAGVAVDSVSEPPTGPFAVTNAERGLAGEVPADTLYYAEGGNVGASLAAMLTAVSDAAAAEPSAQEGIGTLESALGADLEELVAWIDDGAISIGWDGAAPFGGMVLVPNDMAAAERRLDQLASFAGLAALDASSGITVGEREVGSTTVTSIRWDGTADAGLMGPMPTSLVVEYAVTESRVVVGVGDAFVERVIDLDPADALATQPRFADAVADLGGPTSTAIAWMDLAGTMTAVETALGLSTAEDGYATDVRPWLTPLDRIVSVGRIEDGRLMQRTVLLLE